MAKKKVKRYEPPPEKFVVVVNPWGSSGNNKAATLNQIGAWFEVMLQDDFPRPRVEVIYTQGTHKNVIVQLPREIDVQTLLGAHYHADFLKPPYNERANRHLASYIYEYNYEFHDDPSRRNWVPDVPTYDKIPDGFPIKRPYPLPSPAPPPPRDVGYAKPLPKELQQQPGDIEARMAPRSTAAKMNTASALPMAPASPSSQKVAPAALLNDNITSVPRQPSEAAPSSSPQPPTQPDTSHFAPYVRPSYLPSPLSQLPPAPKPEQRTLDPRRRHVIKQDPYKEDEIATKMMQTPASQRERSVTLSEAPEVSVKREEQETTPDQSTRAPVKRDPEDNGYRPSAELLSAFSQLPPGFLDDIVPQDMKPSITSQSSSKTDNVPDKEPRQPYQPSAELLAAMTQLPPGYVDMENYGLTSRNNSAAPARKMSAGLPKVKQEPMDD